MTSPHPVSSSRRSLRAASIALAFAVLLVPAIMPITAAQAQTYKVLYTFTGTADGGNPTAGLIQDKAGNLYGTAFYGGDIQDCLGNGCGVVFKVDSNGNETVIYTFVGGADGETPQSGLIQDGKGNLYGTTLFGGGNVCPDNTCGTVFKLTPKSGGGWTEKVIHRFSGSDGANPVSDLIFDKVGNLYGTTQFGGVYGAGTVFKLDKSRRLTVLHSFRASADGRFPVAGLVQDAAGNLYGTTHDGGSSDYGTVFKVAKTGKETVLHSFTQNPDGANPAGDLVLDARGNLYGTTVVGGKHSRGSASGGTVFKLTKTGKETVIYSFTGNADGAIVEAGLVWDAKGNLYGTTAAGGDSACNAAMFGCGTVFRLAPKRKLTVLYSFTGFPDGALPSASLLRDAKGNLYGTTYGGGQGTCGGNGCGVVFKITP
jgi:uncharacterized repeat protein (TIGR03803 family)